MRLQEGWEAQDHEGRIERRQCSNVAMYQMDSDGGNASPSTKAQVASRLVEIPLWRSGDFIDVELLYRLNDEI